MTEFYEQKHSSARIRELETKLIFEEKIAAHLSQLDHNRGFSDKAVTGQANAAKVMATDKDERLVPIYEELKARTGAVFAAHIVGNISDSAMTERIVAAAVQHGSTISLPRPARHDTILKTMDLIMGIDLKWIGPHDQGFITSEGRFVNRAEAYAIAWRSKQIMETTQGYPLLYSEDLW